MSDIRGEFDNDDDDFSFDDNEFDFGDEGDAGAPQGDFDFGDEGEGEFTFDEGDLDLGDEDVPELGEVEEEREGGISRPFLIIAALMILLFVGGLVAVLLLAGNQQESPFALTSTAVAIQNATTVAQLNASQTKSVIDADLTRTAEALPIRPRRRRRPPGHRPSRPLRRSTRPRWPRPRCN
jgi:hypothetical protein